MNPDRITKLRVDAAQHVLHRLSRTDWTDLTTRLTRSIERDATPGPTIDGHTTGKSYDDGSSAGPSLIIDNERIPATATEVLVLSTTANPDWQPDRDDVHRLTTRAVTLLADAGHALALAKKMLDDLDKLSDPAPLETRGVAQCAEPACEDLAAPGRDGRCEPDYRWRYRWRLEHPGEQPPPVPQRVVDERNAKRIRVSGPFEGELAG